MKTFPSMETTFCKKENINEVELTRNQEIRDQEFVLKLPGVSALMELASFQMKNRESNNSHIEKKSSIFSAFRYRQNLNDSYSSSTSSSTLSSSVEHNENITRKKDHKKYINKKNNLIYPNKDQTKVFTNDLSEIEHETTNARRKGKWIKEEEEFALMMIKCYKNGSLIMKGDTSLRMLLSTKLRCHPMRITNKFSRVFGGIGHTKNRSIIPAREEEIEKTKAILEELERKYLDRLLVESRRKKRIKHITLKDTL